MSLRIVAPSDDEPLYSGEEVIQAVNTSLSTCIHILETEIESHERAGFKQEAVLLRRLIPKIEKLKTL